MRPGGMVLLPQLQLQQHQQTMHGCSVGIFHKMAKAGSVTRHIRVGQQPCTRIAQFCPRGAAQQTLQWPDLLYADIALILLNGMAIPYCEVKSSAVRAYSKRRLSPPCSARGSRRTNSDRDAARPRRLKVPVARI